MQQDAQELNPGRADFWDHFYDQDDGRLHEKEHQHRRARDIAERGSLLDHYEWFMEYPLYESALRAGLEAVPSALVGSRPMHILHVGCGNSDFCDHISGLLSALLPFSKSSSFSATVAEVLNMDICESIIDHLARHFPQRLYAVGNCCDLVVTPVPRQASVLVSGGWFKLRSGPGQRLESVQQSSVDLVFDKGTADALLSSFAGEYNPNMEAYMQQMLEVLRPEGLLFFISINSEDVVNPYVLAAEDSTKSFQLEYTHVIELAASDLRHLRVETLGSRYTCYGYKVVVA